MIFLFNFHSFFREISAVPKEIVRQPTNQDEVDGEEEEEDDELFTTDADILSLHKLLWHSQEKIGKYLSLQRYLYGLIFD